MFASGLLACLWCDPVISQTEGQEPRVQQLIGLLDYFLSHTPLERIALFFHRSLSGEAAPFLRETALLLFGSYDEFIRLLNDAEKRKRLESLRPEDEATDTVFQEARGIRRRFRQSIQSMFLDSRSPLYSLTIDNGVF